MPPDPSKGGTTTDPIRVLLVDDNPEDRALAIRELRRDFPDAQIIEVTDAKHLALTLDSGRRDLVITDYQLRWTDGLAVLRAVGYPFDRGAEISVLKSSRHYSRLAAAAGLALEQRAQWRALMEAERRYLALFNNVPIGLWKTTPEGGIIDANPAAVQLLGYPDRESLLRVNAANLYLDPADRKRWQSLIGRDDAVRRYETQLQRPDGSAIWVEENIRAVLRKIPIHIVNFELNGLYGAANYARRL